METGRSSKLPGITLKENKKKTKGGKSAAANSLVVDSDAVDEVPASSVVVSPENSLILQELAKLSGSVRELPGLKEEGTR